MRLNIKTCKHVFFYISIELANAENVFQCRKYCQRTYTEGFLCLHCTYVRLFMLYAPLAC